MRMKLLSSVALAAAMALATTAAHAAITVSQSAYYSYATDVTSFSSANVICDFDSACTGGNSFVFAGGSAPGTGIFTGTIANISQEPPGDTTAYASVLGPNGTATLTLGGPYANISFFMGSPDTYNSISFFGAGGVALGSFTGAQFTGPPANGNPALGERITFNFNGAAVQTVQFASTTNSFEFDRVGTLAVPEPATWAMMLVGFGGIGAMIRRRRQVLVTA
jgi:PEP-CTERM motif